MSCYNAIFFVGLRPGEKLYEELVGRDETVEPSRVEKILRVKPSCLPEPANLARKVAELERLAALGEAGAVIERLCEIVPTFRPVGMWGSGGAGERREWGRIPRF